MGNAVNIFTFMYLSLSAGSKLALLAKQCYTVIGGDTITSFANTGTLMGHQMVISVAR